MGNFRHGAARLGPALVLTLGVGRLLVACSDDSDSPSNAQTGGAGPSSTRSSGGNLSTGGKAGATTSSTIVSTGGTGTPGNATTGGNGSTGGANSSSISSTTGGSISAGGTSGAGGTNTVATTTSTGGATSAATTAPAGGAISTGGTSAIGGSDAVGGTTNSSGGSDAAGGVGVGGTSASDGGTTGVGGTTATGGSTGGTENGCSNQALVLATVDKPWPLTLDGGFVYFATRALDGKIMRVPIGGGATDTIASGETFPHELAVSHGLAFWATIGSKPGHLIRASVTGADRQEIATGVSPGIFGLNADQNFVYYITNLNTVYELPVGGGTPVQLSGGPYNSFVVDMMLRADQLYWTNTGITTFDWTQAETATITGVDPAGGSDPTALVSRLNHPLFEIAVDDKYVFWNDDKSIFRTNLTGGTYDTIKALPPVPEENSAIVDMVSDGLSLYYADSHTVYRLPVSGGTAEVVTSGWTSVGRLTVDQSNVYFTDNEGGSVVQVAKCATSTVSIGAGGSIGGSTPGSSSNGTTAESLAVNADISDGGSSSDAGATECTGVHGCIDPSVVATLAHAYGLALDEDYVYYSSYDENGSIMRAPIAGGDPQPVVSIEPFATDLAVAGNQVFWGQADTSAGHLVTDLKTGGARQVLATGIGSYGVGRVTSDGTFAYYITGYADIMRIPVVGGTASVVAAGPYGNNYADLALVGDELFWLDSGAWNSTFTERLPNTGFVAKAHISGTSNMGRSTLAATLGYPIYRVAANSTDVYYIDNQFVYRTSRTGGVVQKLAPIAPASGTIVDMELYDDQVYFADAQGVYRIATSGGSVVTLSSGWANVISLAVNGTSVYFTDYSTGAVLQLQK